MGRAKGPQAWGAGVRVLVTVQEAPGKGRRNEQDRSHQCLCAVPATGQGRAGGMHKSVCMVLSQRKSMPGTGPVFKGNE